MPLDLAAWVAERRPRVDDALERVLPAPAGPAATVVEAMRYAVFGGGKRLRPLLAVAAYEACGGAPEATPWEAAAALELVHTYSLVHDDLPAMDDDDLRRGRATAHRAFGEAEAILAGDGLLTLAFEVLAPWPDGVAAVARGAGTAGMVGGQMADLEAEGRPSDLDGVLWIHLHKTGALLAASSSSAGSSRGRPAPRARPSPPTGAPSALQCVARIDRVGQRNAMTVVHLQGSEIERQMYNMLRNKVDMHSKLVDLYTEELGRE